MKTWINIGCGKLVKKSTSNIKWINLDAEKWEGVDIIHNLEKTPLPFKDNSIDGIYASHILEHVTNLTELLKDLHRICKKNAIIRIRVPYFASADAYCNHTHVRCFTLKSFKMYSPETTVDFKTDIRFRTLSKKVHFARKDWLITKPIDYIVNKFQWAYERFFCFIIPFPEVRFTLQVVK